MRNSLLLMLPEFVLLAILVIMMAREMFSQALGKLRVNTIAFAGLTLTALSLFCVSPVEGTLFAGKFELNSFAVFFKFFFLITGAVVVQMCREFFPGKIARPGEFYLVLWVTLIGLFFLVSSADLLVLFISLEIVALSFYIMAAYLKREMVSIEAGLKYLVLGSLASAFVIYGISLVFAAFGTSSLREIQTLFADDSGNRLALLGLLFIVSGIAFKIAAVPFQFWVPDVYEGAPMPVVGFLSVGSKAAGIALMMKVLFVGFSAFGEARVLLFSCLAAMTILYGNLGALVQTNIKRLFGYSSIGHAGYLLIGFAVGGIEGTRAIFYYLIAYGLTSLAAFLVINTISQQIGSDRIDDYRGLAKRSPALAGIFLVALLSLAGIPPMAGFFGKLMILYAAVNNGLVWLAFLGALAVAVSLFYYLSIVRRMYIDEGGETSPLTISSSTTFMLAFLVGGIFLAGIWQVPFLEFCDYAVSGLF